MKYLATFTGRQLGAIGIVYPCRVEVEADDPEAARLKLYDTHEHLRGLRLTPADAAPHTQRKSTFLYHVFTRSW